MRSRKFISFSVFLILFNCFLNGQSIDTQPAKQIIEKGSKGDIILGEKNKKDQLKATPVLLHQKDSVCRKHVLQPAQKLRRKQNGNN